MQLRRSTPLKKEILSLLEKHHLLSAAELLQKLHEKGLTANKTSVYRNLTKFMAEELVCQQSLGNDEFVYELQRDHHDHLQCRSCGLIKEMPCAVKLPAQVEGFAVDHHHLTLFGLCRSCQAKPA